jgi:hypothetical protein
MPAARASSPKTDRALIRSWRRRLRVVHLLAQDLATQRHYFRELRELIRTSKKLDRLDHGGFFASLERAYSDSMSIAVRRIVAGDARSITLTSILKEIELRPELLSRTLYIGRVGSASFPGEPWVRRALQKDFRRTQNGYFDKLVRPGAAHLRAADVRRDLRRLRAATDRIKHHANRRVAHHDRRVLRMKVTFDELFAVADVIEEILAKYGQLIRAGYSRRLLPRLPDDWKKLFVGE